MLIIGAGISGIGCAYHFSKNTDFSFKVLERKDTFGGTWELFKYPGIRSDSDMYSFCYDFHPWKKDQRFGSASEIKDYLQEVIDTYDLEKYICYKQKVLHANWDSHTNRWRMETADGKVWVSKFLFFCTGYYDHDEGYTPDFKGYNDFQGKIIHPQKWPADYDITGKKVVVIGSGATAVTVVPALCDKAHVTMLQRSPTYMMPMPDRERLWLIQRLFIKIFGERMRILFLKFRRFYNILIQYIFFWLCKAIPTIIKPLYLRALSMYLGKEEVEKNWTPRYNLWDQRVCACPEADFQKMIKNKKAKIVTDHIDKFTKTGIALKSGDNLDADVIITATGLKLVIAGKIQVSVDDQPVKFHELFYYKGMMFSDLPNVFSAFGYTNASWTLKVDIVARYACRLCMYMKENNYSVFKPVIPDGMATESWIDMTSSYIKRYEHLSPKQGNRYPWKLKQNYYIDWLQLKFSDLENDIEFQ